MDFWQVFWTIMGPAVLALLSWLSSVIVKFFNSKIKDEKLQQHFVKLNEIVFQSVTEVTQTYVSGLKKEGKFGKEEQEIAFNKSKDIIQSKLTPELVEYIKDNYGDISAHLKTLIESTVYQTK